MYVYKTFFDHDLADPLTENTLAINLPRAFKSRTIRISAKAADQALSILMEAMQGLDRALAAAGQAASP